MSGSGWRRRVIRGVICGPIEALESRRHLSSGTVYHFADYNPIINGATWHYIGSDNQEDATRDMTLVVSNPDATHRNVTFSSKEKDYDGTTAIDSQYNYSVDRLMGSTTGETAASGDVIVTNRGAVPQLIASSVHAGDVGSYSKFPFTETVRTVSNGTYTLNGTDTVSATVEGLEAVTLPDGRFIYGLKVVYDRTHTRTGEIQKTAYRFTDHTIETEWFGKGVGLVEDNATDNYTADNLTTGENDFNDGERDISFTLASGSLLEASKATLDSSGLLMVTGTSGIDHISVMNDKTQTLVYAGAVGMSFHTGAIKSIQILAGDGNDVVTMQQALGAYVDAGTGNDSVTGGPGNDTITGGAGKDTLDGGVGDDRVNGSGGNDLLIGGDGNDRLYGGDGFDTLAGGAGVDRLWGGAGNDVLSGESGSDKLYGEDGDDSLYGGTQHDLMDGGTGTNVLQQDPGDALVTI